MTGRRKNRRKTAARQQFKEFDVAAREPIIDFSELDENKVLADLEEIRRFNPQRYEFEQLTAVIHKDPEKYICVGYKDITDQEFWCRGHMPVRPLMPGVMMCEAAAQLCSYSYSGTT